MGTIANQPGFRLPFSTYPNEEVELRKSIWIGSNCRHGYGLDFMRETRQTCCAYCDRSLTADYNAWLTMVIDHVVPVSVCRTLNIEMEFCRSLANMALACAACNGFDNRYMPEQDREVVTFQDFLKLRDEIFVERKKRILENHEREQKFFEENIVHLGSESERPQP